MIGRLVERPLYDNVIDGFLDSPEIKVLIGVRRCGKSSLLVLLKQRLLKNGVPKNNIINLKLDSYDVPLNPDAEWLNSQISGKLSASDKSVPAYVLIDEVQEVKGWEKVVRKVNSLANTSVFITGSNSRVLSGDLATLLAGRYIEIPVHPLNFSEYADFCNACTWNTSDNDALFNDFLTYGGMPGLFCHKQHDEDAFLKVLSSITDTVVLKDVIARHNIQDPELLNRIIRYVFSTSGNLLVTKKIVDTLSAAGRKSSQETIDNYLKALISSKILVQCSQAGVAGKEILRQKKKFYVVDNGLRNMSIGFNRTRDLGFQFEGLIHNELKTRGWKLESLRNRFEEEIDFLATRAGEKMYVQASLTVLDEKTFEREIHPLQGVNDSFFKFIVVKDKNRCGTTEDGIRIMNILDWLDALD